MIYEAHATNHLKMLLNGGLFTTETVLEEIPGLSKHPEDSTPMYPRFRCAALDTFGGGGVRV
jgi:hypothetical protein